MDLRAGLDAVEKKAKIVSSAGESNSVSSLARPVALYAD
jgi:hypothetical protein